MRRTGRRLARVFNLATSGIVFFAEACDGSAAANQTAKLCTKASVRSIVVHSATELTNAIAKSCDGGTVVLAPGFYGDVKISDARFTNGVTIEGANFPTLHSLTIVNSSHLSLSNLRVKLDGVSDFAKKGLSISKSSDIVVRGFSVVGDDSESAMKIDLVSIRFSKQVQIAFSEFSRGFHAITILDNDGVEISNNYIHDIRVDGIRGGGNSNLTVTKNLLTDFYPLGQIGGTGDHADAIQLWTTNTTQSAFNINIIQNVVYRGKGLPIQGIFLRDQVGTLPYINVRIQENLIVGGMYNGIAVSFVNKLTMSDNVIIATPDQKSWLSAIGSDIRMTGNSAPLYIINGVRFPPSYNEIQPTMPGDLGFKMKAALRKLPDTGGSMRQRLLQ